MLRKLALSQRGHQRGQSRARCPRELMGRRPALVKIGGVSALGTRKVARVH